MYVLVTVTDSWGAMSRPTHGLPPFSMIISLVFLLDSRFAEQNRLACGFKVEFISCMLLILFQLLAWMFHFWNLASLGDALR